MPVQVAVRSYMTAGIAMVGATALIAAPLAVPPPEIHLPAIHASSAEVQLAALANPIAEWVTVIQNTFTNVAALGQQFQNDPAPILQQILQNQLANASTLATALESTAGVLVAQTAALPAATLLAAQQLAAGQFSAAVGTLFQAGIGLILGPAISLIGATSILTDTTQRFANVVAALPNALLPIGIGAISPVGSAVYSFGDAGQAVIDAARAGDVAGALSALVNIPAIVTNAFLNGYAPQFTPGVFSPLADGGLIAVLLNARDTIAQALNVGAPVTANAVAALPTSAKLVGLAEEPTAVASTGAATGEVAAKTSPAATTEASTTEPETEATIAPVAATEPESATGTTTESASSTTKTDSESDSESAAAASSASTSASTSSSTSPSTKPSDTKPSSSSASDTKPSSSSASEASESSTGASASGKSDATKAASTSAGSGTASKTAESKSESKSESKKDSGAGSTGSAGSGGSEG